MSHYYMFLGAHYKLRSSEHVCFGKNFDPTNTPPLKQFVMHMPNVLGFTEYSGSPFYPNMALATREWSKHYLTSEHPVANNDPFLIYLFSAEAFPVSGFLLPEDLVGTQNEVFYNAGHPNEFGGADHEATVRETVTAIGDVRILYETSIYILEP
ncbi:hypothetical protein CIB48_g12187 [Xylaria polymorpha]|nr:hypothetical protein CIB48_g12187 [Xylaria polymorpha]